MGKRVIQGVRVGAGPAARTVLLHPAPRLPPEPGVLEMEMRALGRRDRLSALGSALGHTASGAPRPQAWGRRGQSQHRPKTPARCPPPSPGGAEVAATPVLTPGPSDELRAGRSLRLAKSVSSAAREQPWHRNQGRHRPAPGLQDGLGLDNMAGAASATSKGRRRRGAGSGGAGREEARGGDSPGRGVESSW